MSPASSKTLANYPVLGLLAVTRAALGCGIGIMVANKFQRSSTRQTTAIALLSVGAVSFITFLLRTLWTAINRPESERGMRRRLDSIRGNVGFEGGEEMY